MKEVAYTSAERQKVERDMRIFAMETLAEMAIKAAQSRHDSGNDLESIELEGSIDGVDYYINLGPEGSRGKDVVLIEGLEE